MKRSEKLAADWYSKLQAEHQVWAEAHFPCSPNERALRSALGVVEELSELKLAVAAEDKWDAIADTVIFMSDACSAHGLALEDIEHYGWLSWSQRARGSASLASIQQRLSHASLKLTQDIRGTRPVHVAAIKLALVDVFVLLFDLAEQLEQEAFFKSKDRRVDDVSPQLNEHVFADRVVAVWEDVVSKRDWTRIRAELAGANHE